MEESSRYNVFLQTKYGDISGMEDVSLDRVFNFLESEIDPKIPFYEAREKYKAKRDRYSKTGYAKFDMAINEDSDGRVLLSSNYFEIEDVISEQGYLECIIKSQDIIDKDRFRYGKHHGSMEFYCYIYLSDSNEAVAGCKYNHMSLDEKDSMLNGKSPRQFVNFTSIFWISIFLCWLFNIQIISYLFGGGIATINPGSSIQGLIGFILVLLYLFASLIFLIITFIFVPELSDPKFGRVTDGPESVYRYSLIKLINPSFSNFTIESNVNSLKNPDVNHLKNSSTLSNFLFSLMLFVIVLAGAAISFYLEINFNNTATVVVSLWFLIFIAFKFKYHASIYVTLFLTTFGVFTLITNEGFLYNLSLSILLTIIYIIVDNIVFIGLYKKIITPISKKKEIYVEEFQRLYNMDLRLQEMLKGIVYPISLLLIAILYLYLKFSGSQYGALGEFLKWSGVLSLKILVCVLLTVAAIATIGVLLCLMYLIIKGLFYLTSHIQLVLNKARSRQIYILLLYILFLMVLVFVFFGYIV